MERDAPRLVECAKWYHHHKPAVPDSAMPLTFADEDEARACMKRVLLLEAHHAMRAPMAVAPTKVLSNAVDLETDAPGIAMGTKGGGVETVRSDKVVREVVYETDGGPVHEGRDESVPPPRIASARRARMATSSQKALRRAHERAERKAYESTLSAEERKRLVKERCEAKRARRAEKEQGGEGEGAEDREGGAADGAKDGADGEVNGADGEANEEGGDADEEEGGADDEEEGADEEAHERKAASQRTPDALEAAHYVPPMGEMKPRRVRKPPKDVATFHASPAPHDRYLTALVAGRGALHPNVRDAVLRGTPSEHVVITHGPPGCGKSHALLDALARFHAAHPEVRCFVCGPTNLSAADLYARAFARDLVGCLALAKENMPPGVPRPRNVEVRTARFVFGTVAGRSGRLHDERFGAIFLDEAGMCAESVVWGLLRPDVEYVWMVGDLQQLSARASAEGVACGAQRSMIERLAALGYPSTTLRTQWRMHPEICAYPSRAFYAGELVTAEARATACAVNRPYVVVDAREGEAACDAHGSWSNAAEARRAVAEARALAIEDVVILVPYAAQLEAVRALRSGVEAYTVDSFQGKERDAVVLCTTRTPPHAGFWSDARRLNVALTRAKHALVVLVHGGWEEEEEDEPLGALVRDARARGVLGGL